MWENIWVLSTVFRLWCVFLRLCSYVFRLTSEALKIRQRPQLGGQKNLQKYKRGLDSVGFWAQKKIRRNFNIQKKLKMYQNKNAFKRLRITLCKVRKSKNWLKKVKLSHIYVVLKSVNKQWKKCNNLENWHGNVLKI